MNKFLFWVRSTWLFICGTTEAIRTRYYAARSKCALKDIMGKGIFLEHALSGKREAVEVPVIEHLQVKDAYDLIVVLVRKN